MFDAAAVATGAEVMSAQAAAQQAETAIADLARQAEQTQVPAVAPPPDGESPIAVASTKTTDSTNPIAGMEALGVALQDASNPEGKTTEIVFIDAGVPDVEALLEGIDASAEVVFLDGGSDGLDQITNALKGRSDIDTIHILSEGASGELRLGNAVYDHTALSNRAEDLSAIGSTLAAQGDIKLYGGDTASGVTGAQLMDSLAQLTGADVAGPENNEGVVALASIQAVESRISSIASISPPVLDLNQDINVVNLIKNGTFTGNLDGWATSGTTVFAGDRARWVTDLRPGTIAQDGLTGLKTGPSSDGAAQVLFRFAWNNGNPDTNVSGVFTVSVGGVVYATITTGAMNGNENIATIQYSNGASGASNGPVQIAASGNSFGYVPITINLPGSVADAGSLVFSYSPGNGGRDDVAIDDVQVLTYNRNWNAEFVEDGPPVSIVGAPLVTDADSANMESAKVVLTNGQAGDVLQIGGVTLEDGFSGTVNGILFTVSVNSGVTTINFTGSASNADYADALQSITFKNTSQDPVASPVRDIAVTVSDGVQESNVAHAYITVQPVNDAPVVSGDASQSYTENSAPIAISPDIIVSDVDNSTLAFATVSIANNFVAAEDVLSFSNVPATMGNITATYDPVTGVMTLSSAGSTATTAQWQAALRSVQYSNSSDTPSTNTRTINYNVNDGELASNVASATVSVVAVPDSFTDESEEVSGSEGEPVEGSVLDGTTSVEGTVEVVSFTVPGLNDTFTAGQTATIPDVGSLVINSDGTYTFTPLENFNGAVPVVSYVLSDGSSAVTSTLTITVTPVTDGFTDESEEVSGDEDTVVEGSVLDGTTSVDGTVEVVSFTVPGLNGTFTAGQTATIPDVGSLVINADGTYVFTPVANFNGAVPVVSYVVNDGSTSVTSTLSVNVTAINDVPVAQPDRGTYVPGNPVTIDVLANDSDSDGDPLSVRAVNGVAIAVGGSVVVEGGRVTLNDDGTLTFTPDTGFTGAARFNYTVADSAGAEATGNVELTATPAPSFDEQQLLRAGEAWLPGGWQELDYWQRQDDARPRIYVPGYINSAMNDIQSLNGVPSLHVLEPVRSAVDGIRTLDGLAKLDVPAPVLNVVQSIEKRFVVLDPVEALLSGEPQVLRAGQHVVLGDEAPEVRTPSEASAVSPDGKAADTGAASPAKQTYTSDSDALMFSEQIAFHQDHSSVETYELMAALNAHSPLVTTIAESHVINKDNNV